MKQFLGIFKGLIILTIWVSSPATVSGQGMVTYDTMSVNELAQALVGGGVVISNVVMNCDSAGYGSFNGVNSNLGMNKGIILTSGFRVNAEGPNDDSGVSGSVARGGDADLNTLIPNYSTYDACTLEFDIFTIADTIKFNYIFGSDEYLEFVGTSFNDVFGFFISGPGINGPYSNNAINIALVPGTNTPVSINTVNDVSNSAYYNVNGTGLTAPQNASPYYIQYDGFTKVLTAIAAVQSCKTYHLKLAVSDAGDHILDSGVFIEAGSLISTGVTLEATTSVGNNYAFAVEGCNQGIFNFTRTKVDSSDKIVHFVIGGTASNGIDYTWIPDSITIPANQSTTALTINPLIDGLTEPIERVKIYIVDPCFGNPIDSAWLDIRDYVQAIAPDDTTICPFDTINLTASGGASYLWNPGNSLSNDTISNPNFFPLTSTQYIVGAGVAGCWDFDTVMVTVNPIPPVNAGPDINLCEGNNTSVTVSGANSYVWSPGFGLSDPTIANPIIGPPASTTYTIVGTDAIGCIGIDTLHVFVHPNPIAHILENDTTICPDEAFQLQVTGGSAYSWTPAAGLSDPFISNPIALINAPVLYSVTVTDSNGCTASDLISLQSFPKTDPMAAPDTSICHNSSLQLRAFNGLDYSWEPTVYLDFPTAQNPIALIPWQITFTVTITDMNGCHPQDSVTIQLLPITPADAGPDQIIYRGDDAQLQASGGLSYVWNPPSDLDNPNIPDPIANPTFTTLYIVTVTNADGCSNDDSVLITVLERPIMIIPNAFSPNHDGLNDVFNMVILDKKTQVDIFRIYNRWGDLVFETSDNNIGWTGVYNSIEQPVGTYIYLISGIASDGTSFIKKGNLTLLR